MTIAHEDNYHPRFSERRQSRFLPGTQVEIVDDFRPPAVPPQFAVFDFDGTLSLIREGWPEVMLPLMVDELKRTGTDETDEQLATIARGFIGELTGKQTIYQMIRLAEEVRARGGSPAEPLVYKHRYHERLMQRITGRREALRRGEARPEAFLVPGSLPALAALRARGVRLYLASGTDEQFVREEAGLLGLDGFFGRHIYGALDDYQSFSKQMVVERILKENAVDGSRLIGFGDGYVEIDNIKSAGGIAVAVASDETHRSGKPDPWKRERLIGVGADIVIPDYDDFDPLVRMIWQDA